MEQIPHMGMSPVNIMRARQNMIASRQLRTHTHRELQHKAEQEIANKSKGYQAP